MWARVIDDSALASLAHQVAEQVTVALAEISLARKSATSEREIEPQLKRRPPASSKPSGRSTPYFDHLRGA